MMLVALLLGTLMTDSPAFGGRPTVDDAFFSPGPQDQGSGDWALWSEGVVYYEFDESVGPGARGRTLEAMEYWEAVAAVSFAPWALGGRPHVIIRAGDSFSSGIGMPDDSYDVIIASFDDLYQIAHMLGHVLGYRHEHNRSDRDNYIEILMGNVEPGREGAFDRYDTGWEYGAYDFDSVMHLGECAYLKSELECGEAITIEVKPPWAETFQDSIGQRDHLSYWDGKVMSYMYPEDDWVFVSRTRGGVRGFGSFESPYVDSHEGVDATPSGGTLLLDGGTHAYSVPGDYLSEPMRIEASWKPILFETGGAATAEDFTLVIIPDTQYYTTVENDPYGNDLYALTGRWIADHRDELNIRAALHMGDMVQSGNHSAAQWEQADVAHRIMEVNGVPCLVVPGNHDYFFGDRDGSKCGGFNRSLTLFNEYFGPDRFLESRVSDVYGPDYGHYGSGNENNVFFFDVGPLKYMVVGLEYGPRKDVLCWANNLIARYPSRQVIVFTHGYAGNSGADEPFYNSCVKKYCVEGSRGTGTRDELIRRHSNIRFVLSGHVNGTHHRKMERPDNTHYYEILTDYQYETPEWRLGDSCSGSSCSRPCKPDKYCCGTGNGWIRLMRFSPRFGTVQIQDVNVIEEDPEHQYFPDGEPAFFCGRDYEYEDDPADPDHDFTLEFDQDWDSKQYTYDDSQDHVFHDRSINSTSAGQQTNPEVAVRPDGGFVVVWEDDRTAPYGLYNIFARAFDEGGCETIPEFRVNEDASGDQRNPAVAIRANGSFVVVWQDDADNNGIWQAKGRGFDGSGNPRYDTITLNDPAAGQQEYPDVAMLDNGQYMAVWQDDGGDGKYQIKGRCFTSLGLPFDDQFTVNTESAGQQLYPAIDDDGGDRFVVVWQDDGGDGKYQIKARGFHAGGSPRFEESTMNDPPDGQQYYPDVAIRPGGRFFVVWQDDAQNDGIWQVKGREFNVNGTPLYDQFSVNDDATGDQTRPRVASGDDGNFVVVWEHNTDRDLIFQVWGNALMAGERNRDRIEDFNVNDFNAGDQSVPAIDCDARGNFITVWADDKDSDGSYQVFGNGLDADEAPTWADIP